MAFVVTSKFTKIFTASKLCVRHQSLTSVFSNSTRCLTNSPIFTSLSSRSRSTTRDGASSSSVVAYPFPGDIGFKSQTTCDNNHFYLKTSPNCLHTNNNKNRNLNFCPTSLQLRHYSTTPTSDVPGVDNMVPVYFWGKEIEPFGSINVNAPFNVVIQPLNPNEYPEMNRAFVKLYVPIENEQLGESNTSHWSNLYSIDTTLDEDKLNLTGEIQKDVFADHLPPITCVVQIPIKFNIKVNVTGKANVALINMESYDIFIRCQDGNCYLKNVKTGHIDVYCETGCLESSDVLQGNMRLGCGGDGTFRAKRLQGKDIRCRTVRGNIDIGDIYSEECLVTASEHTILTIGSCHGKAILNINSGDMHIRSVEGNLEAVTQSGDMNVALTNTKKKAYVCSKKGNVTVGLPKPADMDLDFLAAIIVLTKDFTYLAKGLSQIKDHNDKKLMALEETVGKEDGSLITADAKLGILTIKHQDWLSSMGIKSED